MMTQKTESYSVSIIGFVVVRVHTHVGECNKKKAKNKNELQRTEFGKHKIVARHNVVKVGCGANVDFTVLFHCCVRASSKQRNQSSRPLHCFQLVYLNHVGVAVLSDDVFFTHAPQFLCFFCVCLLF